MDYARPDGNLRVLKEEYRDVSDNSNVGHILSTYGDNVLKGSVCALEAIDEHLATKGSYARSLIEQVLNLTSVHRASF